MENNDVSFENSFAVDIMSTDTSLMYIRKKSGPKMEHLVLLLLLVTTLMSDHSVQLSRTCLSKKKKKKVLVMYLKYPLKRRLLNHTLSKSWYMYKKHHEILEYAWKPVYMF